MNIEPISFRITKDLKDTIKVLAKKEKKSFQKMIIEIIEIGIINKFRGGKNI